MKACAHCGHSLADAAPRCLKCGVAVEGDVIGDVFRTVDRPLGGRVPLAGVMIFAALLLAAVLVYLFG